MRLFVGIEFPSPVITALVDCQNWLRRKSERGRFKHWENFHLTLKFLGEVLPDRVPVLANRLNTVAAGSVPFFLELGRAGKFGARGAIRVVWVNVTGETDRLAALQAGVEEAAAGAGFEPEGRLWRPHITLAHDVVFSESAPVWNDVPVTTVSFLVREFAVIHSEEGVRGRTYTPVRRFTLSP